MKQQGEGDFNIDTVDTDEEKQTNESCDSNLMTSKSSCVLLPPADSEEGLKEAEENSATVLTDSCF